MPVLGYSHVAVGVSDMEAAIRFYRDVVGLTLSRDSEERFEVRAGAPVVRRGVYFRWDDGNSENFLVLDHRPRAEPPRPLDMGQHGIHHFAFWVNDVDAARQRADHFGATIVAGPIDVDTTDYAEPAGGTIRTLLVRDPDGNIVQFDQRMG